MVEASKKEYVFGPVPSRRLGRSLGVDLVPYKTCSYDCIYCQLGPTTHKTIERKEWLPLDIIIEQLKEKLSLKPDYITLSGSGEPTLYSQCEQLIQTIKHMADIPVAVLTNGSLLWMPEVRKSLMDADVVIPSLDAGSETLFETINRPHSEISFKMMLYGLIAFRRQYKGHYWLEVMLVNELSTTDEEIRNLRAAIERIQPDKVQINTVTRPPAETFAKPIPRLQLERLAGQIWDNAEIITEYTAIGEKQAFLTRLDDILELLKRRPCTLEDIAKGLGLHPNEAIKYLQEAMAKQLITVVSMHDEKRYYVPINR